MEDNGLSFDNILGEEEIDTLFELPEDGGDEPLDDEPDRTGEADKTGDGKEPKKDEKSDKSNDTAEVADPEELFDDEEQPESVGSGKDKEGKEKEDAATDKDSGSSPTQNFYSSIASALAVDGIFPNLTDDDIKKADDAESFSDLIEAEVNARLDEKQKRVAQALSNGVEPTDIRRYENTLNYLNRVTEAQLSEEGDKGEQLRRNIIYQDFLNKGYAPAKAQKMTERTIDAGTDIEDAKEALQSNKEFYSNAYNTLLKDAESQANAEKAERQKQSEQLKNSIMKDKQLLGDMEIGNDVRKKVIDNLSRPIYKDTETGQYLTALQKYEVEHRADFLKYAGLFYTLTNGFKDFDSFTKGKVKKEVRKGLRELEHTINSTSRDSSGNLRMVASRNEDPDSYIGRGLRLDF